MILIRCGKNPCGIKLPWLNQRSQTDVQQNHPRDQSIAGQNHCWAKIIWMSSFIGAKSMWGQTDEMQMQWRAETIGPNPCWSKRDFAKGPVIDDL